VLNGVDPIILFQFKKLIPAVESLFSKSSVPIVASESSSFPLPFIPLYLSEKLTGVFIDSESKNMDIDTTIETTTDGSTPVTNQRAISNSVKIEMVARANSIGISLFAALADLIFPKVTSKEYSITYLHGAITVFDGLLHSFSITQNSNDDRYNITLELIKPAAPAKAAIPIVSKITGAVPL
jgi:hypothetical protein